MLNHFRTLLLNKTASSEDPLIPTGFVSKSLNGVLEKLWRILFSPNDYVNKALVHSYLNLVIGAGYTEELLRYDQRVTPLAEDDEFFSFSQVSNPEASDFNFPIFVTGDFQNQYLTSSTGDTFFITQVGNTNNIRVFSRATGKYLNETGFFADPDSAVITLTFTGNSSQEIKLANTGLVIRLGKNGGTAFTSTSGKSWTFFAKGPFELDIENRVYTFISPETYDLFDVFRNPDAMIYIADSRQTTIGIQKFAWLLCAFVSELNKL